MPVIPPPRILRQEDNRLQVSLGYIVRPSVNKQNKIRTIKKNTKKK